MKIEHYNTTLINIKKTTLDTLGVTRQGYIGKEKDAENGLGDHGVRKYDYETGRFNSHDVLWEKYYGWTPYQYCMNNPIWAKDWDGKLIDVIADVGFIAYDLWDIGKTIAKGEKVTATQMGALGADILGAVIPFATGGGLAVRAAAKADDAVDVMKNRVKLQKATKEAIKDLAPKTTDGRIIDPNTGIPIEKGQEVFGHKPGQEWSKYKKDPANKGKTRKEVIKDQNNPNIYQIEDKKSNASHKYEK